MTTPEIDFDEIRTMNGTRHAAFEELCCQLASDEVGGIDFWRKGQGGDAGVECFAINADGSETGWQVKYYSDVAKMIESAADSLAQALTHHPAMTRFVVCFPFNLADGRREVTKGAKKAPVLTALARWNTFVSEHEGVAAKLGRTISIVPWGASQLRDRLTQNERSAGRINYWFDLEHYDAEWFRNQFERVRADLAERYSPETHIDQPIRRNLLAATRDPFLAEKLREIATLIDNQIEVVGTHLAGILDQASMDAARDAHKCLVSAANLRGEDYPVLELRVALDKAVNTASTWYASPATSKLPAEAALHLSDFVSALRDGRHELAAEFWSYANARSVLVNGDAGYGKSHLLADTVEHQLAAGRPGILVLGGSLPDAEPWSSILSQLDLPRNMRTKDLLGALNAAGEAAGCRALVAVDAINDKHGFDIWPNHMAGFLETARRYPWITVILSCRTTYEPLIVPKSLGAAKLARLTHGGFSVKEARAYLELRGISVADSPFPAKEFQVPLFLRTCVDGLKLQGAALFPKGLSSASSLFRSYTDAVVSKVTRDLRLLPALMHARRAIQTLAAEIADTGEAYIDATRAEELIRPILASPGTVDRDLLAKLESEGLLTAEIHTAGSTLKPVLRFTFERMSDFEAAESLLARSNAAAGAKVAITSQTPLRKALNSPNHNLPGVMAALATLLPERFACELPDIVPAKLRPSAKFAFIESLDGRARDAFTSRTWQLIDTYGGPALRFDTLIALAVEPSSSFNAELLHEILLAVPMPERDATWSAHIAIESEQARVIIDWARDTDQARCNERTAALTATVLTWFFTTSSRTVRDRATKALAAVLAARPSQAIALRSKFSTIDDPYVEERLTGAIYGAALQGRWTVEEIRSVAAHLYETWFRPGCLPVNALTRDYAFNFMRYAAFRGALPASISSTSWAPPYASPWPIEYVSDRTINSFKQNYRSGYRSTDMIVSSAVEDGDFARYQIDYAIEGWSPAAIGTTNLPTTQDLRSAWYQSFAARAKPTWLKAYHAMQTIIQAKPHGGSRNDPALKAAKTAFAKVVGSLEFERWRAEAEDWRATAMIQPMQLPGAATFNIAWGRRWVCKRAHDLGWSEKLHGSFDLAIGTGRHRGNDLERIGKKYQWIALYELVARMSDNLAILPRSTPWTAEPSRLRNIDPSLIVSATHDDGWTRIEVPSFWLPRAPRLPAPDAKGAFAWLDSERDLFDGAENIEVRDEEGRAWLVLQGFENWRGKGALLLDTWRRVMSIVVHRKDRDAILKYLSGQLLTDDRAFPTDVGAQFRTMIGEFPWRWSSGANAAGWHQKWTSYSHLRSRKTFSVRATIAEHMAEASGYDRSIDQTIHLVLPASWVVEALNIRLIDGRTIQYGDGNGRTIFMDPSVARPGRSAGLIDRTAFMDLLAREELSAIWLVAGEKGLYGDSGDGFGGRRVFTRLYYSDGSNLQDHGRYEKRERPSAAQRKRFMMIKT